MKPNFSIQVIFMKPNFSMSPMILQYCFCTIESESVTRMQIVEVPWSMQCTINVDFGGDKY